MGWLLRLRLARPPRLSHGPRRGGVACSRATGKVWRTGGVCEGGGGRGGHGSLRKLLLLRAAAAHVVQHGAQRILGPWVLRSHLHRLAATQVDQG